MPSQARVPKSYRIEVFIMIVIVDADYNEGTMKGHVAGIVCRTPYDSAPRAIVTATVDNIEEYCPGEFYKRELVCAEAVISQLELSELEMIIVDGFADFGTEKRSLGAYVYDRYQVPVIGIAKNPYKPCLVPDTEVLRGQSLKPLFVTCQGISHESAKEIVRNMAGEHRIPDMVKAADKAARDWTR